MRREAGRPTWLGRLFWLVAIPAYILSTVRYPLADLGPSWRAWRGGGIPGVLTVTAIDYGSKGGCSYEGDWTSEDGTRQLRRVTLDNGTSCPKQVGERLAAVDTGADGSVFRPHDKEFFLVLFIVLVMLGYLLGVVVYASRAWSHRRREVHPLAPRRGR